MDRGHLFSTYPSSAAENGPILTRLSSPHLSLLAVESAFQILHSVDEIQFLLNCHSQQGVQGSFLLFGGFKLSLEIFQLGAIVIVSCAKHGSNRGERSRIPTRNWNIWCLWQWKMTHNAGASTTLARAFAVYRDQYKCPIQRQVVVVVDDEFTVSLRKSCGPKPEHWKLDQIYEETGHQIPSIERQTK